MALAQARILVVYFSRSGTTQKLASAIADALACDVEEIVESSHRRGLRGYWRSLMEARRHTPADIQPARRLASSYDLVVIGTPVWAWSVSSPVRAYLLENRQLLPEVAFFCTMGGRGQMNAFREMERLAGKAPQAVLAIKAREVAAARYGERLAVFVKAVQSFPPTRVPSAPKAA